MADSRSSHLTIASSFGPQGFARLWMRAMERARADSDISSAAAIQVMSLMIALAASHISTVLHQMQDRCATANHVQGMATCATVVEIASTMRQHNKLLQSMIKLHVWQQGMVHASAMRPARYTVYCNSYITDSLLL